MNGRQIEIFYAVMKAGTVTEAAKRLGITQPSATATLKQIEDSLGFNLFHRVGGRLSPTAEARVLYKEAERFQDSLNVFKNIAARLKKDLTSHLRIAAPPALCHELVPAAAADLMKKQKDLLLDITTQHHDQILTDIATSGGQSNLAFTFGIDERANIGTVPIGKAQIVALVPTSLPLSNAEEVTIQKLAAHPLIGTFSNEPLGNAVEQMMHDAGLAIDFTVHVHTHSVAASLVGQGVGVTMIDSVTAAYTRIRLNHAGFKILRLVNAPELPVTAAFSYEHPLSRHAKQLIDIFRHHYRAVTTSSEITQQ